MLSWISLDEIPRIVQYLIKQENISGPVNLVSQNPVSNREFTRTLSEVLKRPAIFPVPPFILRIIFGEMADALLIEGAAVLPQRLLKNGYTFQFPELKAALIRVIPVQAGIYKNKQTGSPLPRG